MKKPGDVSRFVGDMDGLVMGSRRRRDGGSLRYRRSPIGRLG